MQTRRTRAIDTTTDTLHVTLSAFDWDAPLPDVIPRTSATRDMARRGPETEPAPPSDGMTAPQGAVSPSHRANG